MSEQGNTAYYNIGTIRKVGNVPLEIMGLTMSELTMLVQLTVLIFAFGVVVQAIVNITMKTQPMILYYFFLIIPIIIYQMRKINNKYGKGLIFFIFASFKTKDKRIKKQVTVLKTYKL